MANEVVNNSSRLHEGSERIKMSALCVGGTIELVVLLNHEEMETLQRQGTERLNFEPVAREVAP
jgi:hypothetical protein